MAARPPSGCRVRALPAPPLLLSLLLLLGLQPATPGVTCPPPTSVEHADIRVKSYSLKSRERYTCNAGFKRKAGTSSLTECVFNETMNVAHWTIPNLKCISTYSYHSGAMTVVIVSIPVAVLCVVLVVILVCYRKSRHGSQRPTTEAEGETHPPLNPRLPTLDPPPTRGRLRKRTRAQLRAAVNHLPSLFPSTQPAALIVRELITSLFLRPTGLVFWVFITNSSLNTLPVSLKYFPSFQNRRGALCSLPPPMACFLEGSPPPAWFAPDFVQFNPLEASW